MRNIYYSFFVMIIFIIMMRRLTETSIRSLSAHARSPALPLRSILCPAGRAGNRTGNSMDPGRAGDA